MKEMLIKKLVSAFQITGTTSPTGIIAAKVIMGMDFLPPKKAKARGSSRR